MIKRFMPKQPNGNTLFNLPDDYKGGSITIFINGQMIHSEDDKSHPYGYTLDQKNKTFNFFVAPDDDDSLYVLYEYSFRLSFENIDWTKKIRSMDFSFSVQKSVWENKPIKAVWEVGKNPIVWESKLFLIVWEQIVKKQFFNTKVCSKI